ncbi:MAG: hypothetical protein NVSMB58_35750 [Terriglobales bacterium]
MKTSFVSITAAALVYAFLSNSASAQTDLSELDGRWTSDYERMTCSGTPTFLIGTDATTISFAGAGGPISGGSYWRIETADKNGLMLSGIGTPARAILIRTGDWIVFTMNDGQQQKELKFRLCPATQKAAVQASQQVNQAAAVQTPAPSIAPTPQTVTALAPNPSFDCAKSKNEDEQAICGNVQLATKDQQLATLYTAALQGLSHSSEARLRDEQRTWLKLRRSCGTSEHCLLQAYTARLRALQNWH